jgi:glycosyltransferase involved in cell wall biosynthesis
MKFGKYLKNADGTYDAAFGITDSIMTCFIVDKVNARKKYHWVRSDYRILNLDKCVEEAYFSNLNGVLAVSKTCADIFVDEFPVFKNRIYVFRNYIPIKYYSSLRYDSSLIDKNDGCIRIGSVCRLDPLKGIELSIDACRKLLDGGYKVKWYIIGGGPQEYAIRKQIESYRVNDNFILLGFRKNVYSYLKDFDIFVLSSRTEGRSNAVDEAIACNLPIVVTHYPTVGDQITDKRNGLICELNGDSISKSVGLLIDNYPLRQFLINNCKSQNNSDTNNSIKIFESLT